MTTFIFLAFFICLLLLVLRLITNAVQGKDVVVLIRMILGLVAAYILLWLVFFAFRQDKEVPLGVDSCFDDWCAMVTGAEYPVTLGRPDRPVYPQGQFILLYVRMSNHARRVGQKPSFPRVVLLDARGRSWGYSERGQAALEVSEGPQEPLDSYLAVHQSIETGIVFDVPTDAKGLKARIEEGPPFLDYLLLPTTRQVVPLP